MTDEIAKWLTSPAGRWARIGAGIALVASGAASRKPLLAALGLLPLIGGVFDVLLISPLLAVPTTGRKIRREIGVLQDTQLFPPASKPEGMAEIGGY
jgi:hypothetical protein